MIKKILIWSQSYRQQSTLRNICFLDFNTCTSTISKNSQFHHFEEIIIKFVKWLLFALHTFVTGLDQFSDAIQRIIVLTLNHTKEIIMFGNFVPITGKSLSEALLFAEHGENMLCTKIVLNVRNNFCTHHVLPRFELGIFMYWTCNSMNNLSSYYGLVDAKIRASDKDLPVLFNSLICL